MKEKDPYKEISLVVEPRQLSVQGSDDRPIYDHSDTTPHYLKKGEEDNGSSANTL